MRALMLSLILMPLLTVSTVYGDDDLSLTRGAEDQISFTRGQFQQQNQGQSRKVPGYGRYDGYNKYQTPAYQNRNGNPNYTNTTGGYGAYPTTGSPVIINSTPATPSMYGPAPHQ